jgi:UDP-N-acetylglucosamine acyltransferase
MATLIADTACIDPRADLGDDVEIGPYCVVGPDVTIGRGTRLIAHACIQGTTILGEENVVHPFAVIGGEPQDVSFRGSQTCLEIGDRNVIREGVTIHRGSEKEQGVTRIGSNNLLMVNVHVAHDCVIDDRVIIANNTILGGHVCDDLGGSGNSPVCIHRLVQLRGGLVADLSRRPAVHDH